MRSPNFSFLMVSVKAFALGAVFLSTPLTIQAKNEFHFVTLGDTAYKDGRLEEYRELIKTINRSKPAFSIHVGDTMGYQACEKPVYEQVLSDFNSYNHPLIYTPGDNEWADCWDPAITHKDKDFHAAQTEKKLGALKRVREMYFGKPESLGRKKIKLTRQSDVMYQKEYVENAYWEHNGVFFATIHVVGSNDSLNPYFPEVAEESIKRRLANIMWLEHLLGKIEKEQPKAVVFSMHAALFSDEPTRLSMKDISNVQIRSGNRGPYTPYVQRIAKLAQNYKRPILFIHGDFHEYIIDRPFYLNDGESEPINIKGENITRLQVFGSPELKAVKVTVEPDTPWVFGFTPLF